MYMKSGTSVHDGVYHPCKGVAKMAGHDVVCYCLTTMSQISSGIENLFDSSSPTLATQRHAEMNHESLPNEMFPPFYQAWSDDDFCNLCMSIYGVGTKTELHAKIVRTPLCMNEFLRGVFAAAVTEWEFNERYESVPRD